MTTPINIKLIKSNINFSTDKLLQEWGCDKYDWGDFTSFPHFSRFGYNIFTMPSEKAKDINTQRKVKSCLGEK